MSIFFAVIDRSVEEGRALSFKNEAFLQAATIVEPGPTSYEVKTNIQQQGYMLPCSSSHEPTRSMYTNIIYEVS